MLQQNINKSGGSKPPSPEIITYSPSKFMTRVGPGENTYTTSSHLRTHTHTQAATGTAATATTKTNNSTVGSGSGSGSTSYYVVKAGSLGSAASMTGSVKVSTPPKAGTVTKSPSLAVTSPATPTESSSTISAPSESSFCNDKMEHSYMRDPPIRSDACNGLAPARNILVRHPPQCPSCHTYPQQQSEELAEFQQAHVPPYDEIAAKEAMHECARIAKYVKNNNSDEQDWVARVNQFGWTPQQQLLFEKVTGILDQDQLARLANDKRQHEAVHRRVSIDKSASRLRKALANVGWDQRITQWLHALLMEYLSPSYMASYLDILQTLKSKLPTLVDKMLFSRPLNSSQELLAPVMKKRWEPNILPKGRQLTHNAIMVVLPTMPTSGHVPERMQKWYQALATITQVVQITLPNTNNRIANQNLDQVAETIVSLTRVKIHELRTENPNRGIILIGFNAGSALALQVALSESVACVVCMGFAYNTARGPRGTPDDRMLDIKAPILFVIGQNSARTSQEEMEGLRERMQSESSLVVVGSADDALRVPKSKRRIEGVTQSMVDAMVIDELFDFVNRTLSNPPGPRMPTSLMHNQNYQRQPKPSHILADGNANKAAQMMRKRKIDGGQDDGMCLPAKSKFPPHIGRPRTRPLPKTVGAIGLGSKKKSTSSPQDKQNLSSDELNQSIEFILDETMEYDDAQSTGGAIGVGASSATSAGGSALPKVITPGALGKPHPTPVNLAAGTKIKMIPPNQFVQIKTLPSQVGNAKLINYALNKSGGGTPTHSTIGNIVKTIPGPSGSGQQVYTLKGSAQSGASASGSGASSIQGQQKYTVFKNANGMTMLQLTKNVPTPPASSSSPSLDLSNIIDMPIVFADNEGNIAEQQKQADKEHKPVPIRTASKSPLIISQKIIKEANKPSGMVTTNKPGTNIVLNKGLHQLLTPSPVGGGQNKVVYLNRSSIKPVTGGHRVPIRIVSSPKTGGASNTATSSPLLVDPATGALVPSVKTVNIQAIKPTTSSLPPGALRHAGNVSLGNKTYQQFQVINSPAGSTTVSADGKAVRNIYFKSAAGLKQVPVQMIANRVSGVASSTSSPGTAVRRVVNIGPVPKISTTPGVADAKVIKLQTATAAPSSQSKI
ncbi:uncharacterized protein Dana_GF12905, isoform D [Drosophila ananassae]|uniref:Uncharacterized protein, isoform D n=1 Tax=Drosophila ananassae TaxID=7217 RepID=A0A0P8XNA2_DROAN|nr:KAT8 regulatory NSL complex subunit 3 isoform X2 [Drosophila ananassae]KPU76134.1 uncharacterized protein Dana_GF12905, isoform D [Drosophila ananassae]